MLGFWRKYLMITISSINPNLLFRQKIIPRARDDFLGVKYPWSNTIEDKSYQEKENNPRKDFLYPLLGFFSG